MLAEQQWELADRDSALQAAERLAHSLHCHQPADLLCGAATLQEFRPDLVTAVLADLHPHNLRVTLLTRNARYLETVVEPHYGTE